MKISLNICEDSCIKCARCVTACPMMILSQQESDRKIVVNNIETCIKCGHCAAICPTKSVEHSLFGPDKIHHIDSSALPTAEQVMLLIQSRRANRAFTPKAIPQALIDTILKAANHAPTASNGRELGYTVITNPDVLRKLSQLTLSEITSKIKRVNNPIVSLFVRRLMPQLTKLATLTGRMQKSFNAGGDPVLKGATAVILIHAPKGSRYGRQDANLAYQNGSLMAESLGVGQFYTGFICSVVNQSKQMRKLLNTESEIHAGMALGIPKFTFANYVDRDDLDVKHI